MKKVLLVINNDAFGRQIKRWALLVKKQGEWEPVIFITHEMMNRHLEECRINGITILSFNPPSSDHQSMLKKSSESDFTIVQKLKGSLRQNPNLCLIYRNLYQSFYFFHNFISLKNELLKKIRIIKNLLDQHQINAVVIPESGPAYEAPLFIHSAHAECIPVITIPTEKYSATDFAEYYLTDTNLNINSFTKKLVGHFFPHWVISHKGHRILRVQLGLIFVFEYLHLSPPHPWKMVGNDEDIVAVDSKTTYDFYLNEGVSPSQMQIIGTSEHDFMTEIIQDSKKRKSDLYNSLGLRSDRPLILSALIADHYLSGRPECDFKNYSDMVQFWVQSLATAKDYNIIVSLHPSQKNDEMSYIEQWGVKICHQDIVTLIPLCDIFIALSSTIPWAIACSKPVIVYDPYRYNFDSTMYKNVPGVIYVKEQHDFIKALQRLTTDPEYYKEVVLKQAAYAEQWGKLDGKTGDRFIQLFNQVTNPDT